MPEAANGFELVYQPSFDLQGASDEAAIAARFEARLNEVRPRNFSAGCHWPDPTGTILPLWWRKPISPPTAHAASSGRRCCRSNWPRSAGCRPRPATGPILLLDDILSELDVHRRQYVLDTVQARADQILITATDLAFFGDQEVLRELATLYLVEGGSVKRV